MDIRQNLYRMHAKRKREKKDQNSRVAQQLSPQSRMLKESERIRIKTIGDVFKKPKGRPWPKGESSEWNCLQSRG